MTDLESAPDLKARSPWASLSGVTSVTLSPCSAPVCDTIRVAGSKSFTNRALIIASAAKGVSRLTGLLKSDDSYWCIDALRKLGVQIQVEEDFALVHGVGGEWPAEKATLYIGAAGTTARFLPGTLAAAPRGEWTLEASTRMSERPVGELVDALRTLGADISYLTPGKSFPMLVKGTGLAGGPVTVSGKISSQFLSGVLIASPLAAAPVTVTVTDGIVQYAYIDMTIALMSQFGARVSRNEALTRVEIEPTGYHSCALNLEADASTCGYFLSLAALTGGCVRISNISYGARTTQPDIQFVDVLEQMGCVVVRGGDFTEVRGPHNLKGGLRVNMQEMSDQTLTLAALAPFADGPINIYGAAHIRHHESDRIRAICGELRRAGIGVEERDDGLTVQPGTPQAGEYCVYDDHRMAMSLALWGSKVAGIRLRDPGCVSKTCPNYFEEIEKLGLKVQYQ
jgi:3-phosphoshikimate 1-carboxyvinyltransferase